MRIALINPRVETYSSILPPLGLLYIASVLEKNNIVKVFDPLPNDYSFIEQVVAFNPGVVGLSILTTYAERAKTIITRLKAKLGSSFFVVGGVHPTALPEHSLSFFDVDCVVIGEGELTMNELCDYIEQRKDLRGVKGILFRGKNREIIRTEGRRLIENLDEIPFPNRDYLDFENYLFPPGIIRGYWSERSTTVITGRGCPYNCIWCGSHILFGRKVRHRSVNNVLSEIKLLISKYKVDTIWFIDDTFTIDIKWVEKFCEEIHRQNIIIKWGCQARINTVNLDMLKKMKSAGCVQLDFGVESGSEKVLKALKKDTNPQMAENAFRITKKAGLRTLATFIIGNPKEEKEDLEKTVELAKKIRPDFISFYYLTPFPGTELMELAEKNNWIKDHSYSQRRLKYPIMEINFTRDELIKIRKKIANQFIWSNYAFYLKNLTYLLKGVKLMLGNPESFLRGLFSFLKTGVFDDFIFVFLISYTKKRQMKKR